MTRLGHTTKKYYKETKGIKVSGGQFVKAGTVLTRQGNKWKAGSHVLGLMHLTAACDGQVYFTRRRNKYKTEATYINIRPLEEQTTQN